jgi:hypothetical protein
LQYPADLANLTGLTDMAVDPTTTSFGFPKQFHELLARRVGMERKMRTPGAKLTQLEMAYETDLRKALDAIAHQDLSLEIIGELPQPRDLLNDGWDA